LDPIKNVTHPFDLTDAQAESLLDIPKIVKMESFQEKFKEVYDMIAELPGSRFQSLAVTALEEVSHRVQQAVMFGDCLYPHQIKGLML